MADQVANWMIAISVVAVLVASRRGLQRPVLASPVVVSVLVLLAIGAGGAAMAGALEGLPGGGIRITIADQVVTLGARLFLLSALCLCVGGIVGAALFRRGVTPAWGIDIPRPQRSALNWLIVASAIPALVLFFSMGQRLFERENYLATRSASVEALALVLSLGAVSVLGYAMAVGSPAQRLFAVLVLLPYPVMYIALGTRRLALLPILLAIGIVVGVRSRPARFFTITILSVVAVLLLPIPLSLRAQPEHGLVPYLAVLASYDYSSVNWLNQMNNVLISFPLASSAAFERPPVPVSNLMLELSPLPGEWVGWYDAKDELRFNPWTPYPAIGVVGNYGWGYVVAVWLYLGLIVGYLESRTQHYFRTGAPLVAIALVGLVALFAIQACQYPLRTSFRMLVYAIAIDLGVRFLRSIAVPRGWGRDSHSSPSRRALATRRAHRRDSLPA